MYRAGAEQLAEQDSAAKMSGRQVQRVKDPGNDRWVLDRGRLARQRRCHGGAQSGENGDRWELVRALDHPFQAAQVLEDHPAELDPGAETRLVNP